MRVLHWNWYISDNSTTSVWECETFHSDIGKGGFTLSRICRFCAPINIPAVASSANRRAVCDTKRIVSWVGYPRLSGIAIAVVRAKTIRSFERYIARCLLSILLYAVLLTSTSMQRCQDATVCKIIKSLIRCETISTTSAVFFFLSRYHC